MSSSGADASDLDAALALLSGPQLVAHLRATCRRADYSCATCRNCVLFSKAAVLAEFLLDGDLQGPLKRTVEDLAKHDSTGHDFLERVVLRRSEQLFSIYRNKDDKYFR